MKIWWGKGKKLESHTNLFKVDVKKFKANY